MSAIDFVSSGLPVTKSSFYSACSSGGNRVWQMEEYVFLSRLTSPSHLNKLFDYFNYLLKRRTTVVLSELVSQTSAIVEPFKHRNIHAPISKLIDLTN